MVTEMSVCNLCPRGCAVDRKTDKGYCSSGDEIILSKAMLHMWEEPCISGTNGSGAVFFGGCHLGCIYCQNSAIALNQRGRKVSEKELCDVFLDLQKRGAHNINLVTPTHFADKIANVVSMAKKEGLCVPVIYNTGGYERKETVAMLKDTVDVYLPDFKYINSDTAQKYSNAPDYPQRAKEALEEMVQQKSVIKKDLGGLVTEGVIVRHMLLPGSLKNSKAVIEYLYKTYGDSIYISIMNQYTPIKEFEDHPELSFVPTQREYQKLIDYALSLGVKNAYIQGDGASSKEFIPDF